MKWIIAENVLVKKEDVSAVKFSPAPEGSNPTINLILYGGETVTIIGPEANHIWKEFSDEATPPEFSEEPVSGGNIDEILNS